MSDKTSKTDPKTQKKQQAKQRLADALKHNLRRRKVAKPKPSKTNNNA